MFVLLFHEKLAWNKRTSMRKKCPRKFDLQPKVGGYFFAAPTKFFSEIFVSNFFLRQHFEGFNFSGLSFLHFYLFFLIFIQKFFGNFCSLTEILSILMFHEFVCSKKFKALLNIKEHVLLFHDFEWNMFFL